MADSNYLQQAKQRLYAQAQAGRISYEQAEAELQRLRGIEGNVATPGTNPGLAQAQQSLAQQVAMGWINQAQADAEYQRLLTASDSPYAKPGLTLNNPTDVINTAFDTAKGAQTQGNLLTNPNQYSAFGSQTVTIDPITGQPTVKQDLSEGNQGVVSGLQGAGSAAGNQAQQIIGQGALGSLTSGAGGPMSAFEQAYYDQLTRGVSEQQGQEREAMESRLANRGIPVGSEAYKREMDRFDQRYDDIFSNARNQALTGSVSTGLQALPTLTGVGTAGYFNPTFQGFNAVQYQQPNVNDIFNTVQGTQLGYAGLQTDKEVAKIQADASKANAALAAQTSKHNASLAANSGGGQQPTVFNNTPPPGSN